MEEVGRSILYNRDSMELYDDWNAPTVIVSDGAYGVEGFESDPSSPEELKNWYEPHVKKWSESATPETTLWFWNTEQGWAEVHGLLKENNWDYRGANIWNKSIQHISGNSNTEKLRKFPQVTEICVQYVRDPIFEVDDRELDMQDWLRYEWDRSGLNLYEANDACGVSDAASRKYLTKDDEWYFPPPDAFEAMATYANKHGDEDGKPYFSIEGEVPDAQIWKQMRAKFECPSGLTNVWDEPPLHGEERIKDESGKYIHLNQKPKALVERIIEASSDKNDIVWSPFGGLFTTPIVSNKLGRRCYSSEINDHIYELGLKRIKDEL